MWLINVETRLLKEYIGSNVPPYAILSHTWEEEEVSFRQYVAGNCKKMKGYTKIDMTCRIAQRDKIGYAWVDTCCIDKSSSAELSEAINSMFRWYQRAQICYAYLSDLPVAAEWGLCLGQCRWFTRGWTIQELIAPNEVKFFDSQWNTTPEFTKSELTVDLSSITHISTDILAGRRSLDTICVAQKMSWAAKRTTTRIEDRAYCLLGLFDLQMPLLYGEEDKAFQRLQEEIIRSTADLSILAWVQSASQLPQYVDTRKSYLCGVLAKSPDVFAECGQYERSLEGGLREFTVTNIGIRTRIPLEAIPLSEHSYSLSVLVCRNSRGFRLGVRLRQAGGSNYLRRDPWHIQEYNETARVVHPPLERFLLTRVPRVGPRIRGHALILLEHCLFILRGHIDLRLLLTPPANDEKFQCRLNLQRPWPVERYDHEDVLFAGFRDDKDDFGFVDVVVKVNYPEQYSTRATIIFVRPSLWTAPEISIVDGAQWSSILEPLRDQGIQSQYDSTDFFEFLRENRVPRTLSLGCLIGEKKNRRNNKEKRVLGALSIQRQRRDTSMMAVVSIKPVKLENDNTRPWAPQSYGVEVSAKITLEEDVLTEALSWGSLKPKSQPSAVQ